MKNHLPSAFRTLSLSFPLALGWMSSGTLGLPFFGNGAQLLAAETSVSTAVPVELVKPFAPPVVIQGNAHQRGVAFGNRFRAETHEFLNTHIYNTLVSKTVTKEDMLQYAEECGKVVREVDPMIADEIAGIAEGAGISPNEAVLLQLHEEVYQRANMATAPRLA